MTFSRNVDYVAAYTDNGGSPSYDPELKTLLDWISSQPGKGLLFVAHDANATNNSPLAAKLVAARAATYKSKRQLGNSAYSADRIVLLWPDAQLLRKIDDSIGNATAVGVLTWLPKDVEQWVAARNAIDVLSGATPPNDAAEIGDPIVLGAMRSLTNSVNLSTGITHPMDWDQAVNTFRLFRKRRIPWEPDQIERWAMANGWHSEDAHELRGVAAAYHEGKSKQLKGRSPAFSVKSIDYWATIGRDGSWKAF